MADKADGSCKSQLWPCSNPLALSEQEHMHIGDYCAFKAIGFGGYGKVMLGQHLPTKQEVAIKIIYKAELSDYSLQEIYREVDILVTLDHPNIVKLIDYIDTNNALYLIMEFASGGDVFDYIIKKGKLCEDEARAFFRQVITAVDYCHKNNVAHRDLKAENLLLDEDNIIKLADFGLSKSFSPGQRLQTPCGTTSYKAPELHLNKTYHGPAADTWSLGVLLYMMVTADLPFLGWSEIETRERVLRGQYFIPWYLSFDCERLLKKLLVRNPKKRAALEDIMKDKWLNTGYDVLQPYVVPEDSNNTDAAGPSSAAVENRTCNTRKRKRERLPSFLPIRNTSQEASSGASSQSGHSSTLPLKKRKLFSYP